MAMDTSGLVDLREISHARALKMRNIDRIVQSVEFRAAWQKATSAQRYSLKSIVCEATDMALNNLVTTVRFVLCSDLESMPYAQVRVIASKEQVIRYSRMSKDEMIRAIQKVRADRINKELGDL